LIPRKSWRKTCIDLIGNDSEEAWRKREWLRFDQKVQRLRGGRIAKLLKAMGLNKSKWWFRIRTIIDNIWPLGLYLPGDLLLSTIGTRSSRKYKLLQELADLCPAEAIICSLDDDAPICCEIKKKYENDKNLRWAYDPSIISWIKKNY
jgi:hypothetical protein